MKNEMQICIDSGNIKEIEEWSWFINCCTTNPSLLSKEKDNYLDLITKICKIKDIPVSVEVLSNTKKDMINEAIQLSTISDNIVIKIPMTCEGIQTLPILKEKNIKTNVTLIFSINQALTAAKAGADYASIFVGRLDDLGINGMNVVREVKEMYHRFGFNTKIITASIRSLSHIEEAAKIGSDVATIPPKFLSLMFNHELTDLGIQKFEEDWSNKKHE